MRDLAQRLGASRDVVALSFARLGDAVGNSLLYVVLPLYVAQLPSPAFPLNEAERVGILISLYGFANALAQPFAGALSDRLGRRKPLIELGLVIVAVSTIAFAAVSRYEGLLGLRVLQGLGAALTIPTSVALLTVGSRQQTRGGSMGIYTTLRILGLAIGPLLGGAVLAYVGFDATFFAGGAFVAVGLLAVWVWVREVRGERPARGRQRRIFDREVLTAAALSLGFATFAMAGAFAMIVTLENQFNQRLRESALGFAIAFSALMITRLLLQVPVGRLSDQRGRKPFIIGGLLLMVPGTALLGLSRTALELTALRVVQGVGSAGVAAPAFALAGDLSRPDWRAQQLSLITMGFGLGLAVGPLIAGFLAGYNFSLPFLIASALLLVGAWLVWRYVPETVRRGGDHGKGA